jgi:hypothetical protein
LAAVERYVARQRSAFAATVNRAKISRVLRHLGVCARCGLIAAHTRLGQRRSFPVRPRNAIVAGTSISFAFGQNGATRAVAASQWGAPVRAGFPDEHKT